MLNEYQMVLILNSFVIGSWNLKLWFMGIFEFTWCIKDDVKRIDQTMVDMTAEHPVNEILAIRW